MNLIIVKYVKIEEPLYWADPKFYDIPKVFFCDAEMFTNLLQKN